MTKSDERDLLAIAQEAAEAAAAELLPRFGERARGVRSKSTPTDLVSDADVAAEKAIRDVLEQRRPDDSILGEEGGTTGADEDGAEDSRLRWIVDPLDGTINYLFGIPAFAVSVACEDASGAVAGVVLDPIREECFQATRTGPPTMNGAEIHASGREDLATAMVATGLRLRGRGARAPGRDRRAIAPAGARYPASRGCRTRSLLVCVRSLDAFYERGLHAWDIAAGSLIVQRAGLQVRELAQVPGDPSGVVVAPGAFMAELYELVNGG